MSGAPRSIGHALKEKFLPRSRKLSPQSTSTSNSRSTPALPAPSSPSTLTTSQPPSQSPPLASDGESPLLSQHRITISTPQQNPSSTSQSSLKSLTPVSNDESPRLSRNGTPSQNPSSATAALPLWQRVYSIAKDQLSKKECEQLDLLTAGNDSIESAISAAEDAHKAAKDRRWVYRRKQGSDIVVMERLGRILRGMENYAKIGDVLMLSSPEITALVWGAARSILQVGHPPSPVHSN